MYREPRRLLRSQRDGRNVRYAFLYELLGPFGDFPFRLLIEMVAPSASDRKISRTRPFAYCHPIDLVVS